MKSKSTRDVHVEEDKTNVIQWHGKAEKARGFLFWLEKLERFGQLCNDDQRQCPEKLVCKIVRFHGCRWRKAFHCLCMDTLRHRLASLSVAMSGLFLTYKVLFLKYIELFLKYLNLFVKKHIGSRI